MSDSAKSLFVLIELSRLRPFDGYPEMTRKHAADIIAGVW